MTVERERAKLRKRSLMASAATEGRVMGWIVLLTWVHQTQKVSLKLMKSESQDLRKVQPPCPVTLGSNKGPRSPLQQLLVLGQVGVPAHDADAEPDEERPNVGHHHTPHPALVPGHLIPYPPPLLLPLLLVAFPVLGLPVVALALLGPALGPAPGLGVEPVPEVLVLPPLGGPPMLELDPLEGGEDSCTLSIVTVL